MRNKLIQAQKHKLAGHTEIILSLTKQYRALKQRKIRNFISSFYDNLDDCKENDQVQMWSLLKAYLKKKNTVNISNDIFNLFFRKQCERKDTEHSPRKRTRLLLKGARVNDPVRKALLFHHVLLSEMKTKGKIKI